jgi:D-aminoacyl-tRNA deacylase
MLKYACIFAWRLAGGWDLSRKMRAVIQRVNSACVRVEGFISGQIDRGLVILLGIEEEDGKDDVEWLATKVAGLRIFAGEDLAPWACSVVEVSGGVLVVSQFTLFASTRKGTKPSWHRAAKPEVAIPLYEQFIARLNQTLSTPVATGRFGAMMEVELINDGPVTLIIDTKQRE